MTLVNLTPHAVVLVLADGTLVAFPPSGKVARVSQLVTRVGTVSGRPW